MKSYGSGVLERDLGELCKGCNRKGYYIGNKFFKRYYCNSYTYSMMNKKRCDEFESIIVVSKQ